MIDTHCHIHFNAYKDDMEDVIARTREKGVRMITIGTQTDTSKKGIEVAEANPDIWCTVGVHPSHTHKHTLFVDDNESIETRAEVFDKAFYKALIESSDKVVAIGEVGLDYYRLPEEGAQEVIDTQKAQMQLAIELANETNKPLVMHIREAHADMLEMLKKEVDAGRLERRGVVHCFTGTTEEARAYHTLGFYTSFTGIITFPDKKNPDAVTPLQQTVKGLPLEWMLVETDAPYLTPMPDRGKRNEPWQVVRVAQKVAELKGVSLEEVDRITTQNAETLFGLTKAA